MISLSAEKLGPLMVEGLVRAGASREAAVHVAASMVQTSLRGVDSHGIHLFAHYARAVRGGRVARQPEIAIDRRGAAVAVVDAGHAFGHHAGAVAIDVACELAAASGVGAVSVGNSTHLGAAAYFGLRAAERGYIAFAFTNADALVKAHGGLAAFFGTNPICFTAPMKAEGPLCLDMATSTVSWNRVRTARTRSDELPPGVAFDAQGMPTRDANAARMLAPTGGYKGYGLGMMIVEILCGVLAAGPVGPESLPMFSAPIEARRRISHFFLVVDVARMLPLDVFRARLQEMADAARALTAGDDGPVQVPGDPEKRAQVRRSREGIPIDDPQWQDLLSEEPTLAAAATR